MEELSLVTQQHSLNEESAAHMQKAFAGFMKSAREIVDEAKGITVTSEEQTELMEEARVKRIKLKDIRVNVEKERKSLKEESLRTGKAIDGLANVIKFLIVPVEKYLQEQENFVKFQEEKRKVAVSLQRIAELEKYGVDVDAFDLVEMEDSYYDQLLENSKILYQNKKEAVRRAEEERIDAEKKRIAEEARMRKENEALKKEREKEEAERLVQAKKLQEENAARLKAEKELKDREEKEARVKAEEAQRVKDAELARLRAEKQATLAPDKEKIKQICDEIGKLKVSLSQNYTFANSEVIPIIQGTVKNLDAEVKSIMAQVEKLV